MSRKIARFRLWTCKNVGGKVSKCEASLEPALPSKVGEPDHGNAEVGVPATAVLLPSIS